jgi:hypothetical protein
MDGWDTELRQSSGGADLVIRRGLQGDERGLKGGGDFVMGVAERLRASAHWRSLILGLQEGREVEAGASEEAAGRIE